MAVTMTSREPDQILRPRPVKPLNPAVLRAQQSMDRLQVQEQPSSGVSSGRSTPIPDDAPPSVHSLSSAKKQARAQAKHRQFFTIHYTPRVSHFDPNSEYRDFRGFFILFWISLFIMVLTTALRNFKDTGYPMRMHVWGVLSQNVVSMGLSDLAMVSSTVLSLPMHRLYRKSGPLQWSKGGIWIHSIYQTAWLLFWVECPFMLQWTWTAQVFFILHTLVFLMKMHSYMFYNGHLSETERRLRSLDQPENEPMHKAVKYPSSPSRLKEVKPEFINGNGNGNGINGKVDSSDEDDRLDNLRADLAEELTSPLGKVTYPHNLTTWNYIDYIFCPTLCYELEYPREPHIRWFELFIKALAVFGCIFLMTLVSEEFILPVLADGAVRLQHVSSFTDKGLILAETISLLLFPFMVTFLLTFLVIFEYLLGAFAEMTCFADRHFYSDWWNSSDWLEFSREWNVPVHDFLRRHVFFSSKAYFGNSIAMLITFLVSAFGHELIMGCITKKLRGYGFIAMMLQLPIVAVQKSRYVRGRWVLNNATFWASMILGLSIMCALYVLV